jgi:hypothetical protein
MGIDKPLERGTLQHRDIARKEYECPLLSTETGFGLLQGVGGAKLRLLQYPPHIWLFAHKKSNRVRFVSDDHGDCCRMNGLRHSKHMLNKWFTRKAMKHLRQPGFHPGALPGRQNDNMDLGRAHYLSLTQFLARSITA